METKWQAGKSFIKLSSEGLLRVMQLFLGNCKGGYMSYRMCQNP